MALLLSCRGFSLVLGRRQLQQRRQARFALFVPQKKQRTVSILFCLPWCTASRLGRRFLSYSSQPLPSFNAERSSSLRSRRDGSAEVEHVSVRSLLPSCSTPESHRNPFAFPRRLQWLAAIFHGLKRESRKGDFSRLAALVNVEGGLYETPTVSLVTLIRLPLDLGDLLRLSHSLSRFFPPALLPILALFTQISSLLHTCSRHNLLTSPSTPAGHLPQPSPPPRSSLNSLLLVLAWCEVAGNSAIERASPSLSKTCSKVQKERYRRRAVGGEAPSSRGRKADWLSFAVVSARL